MTGRTISHCRILDRRVAVKFIVGALLARPAIHAALNWTAGPAG